MLRSMTSSQFTEWIAYFRVAPPEDEWDYRFGMIAAAIYNTTPRGKTGSRKVYQPSDFFPERAVKPPPTPEEMLQKVVGMNQTLSGRDLRGQNRGRDGKRRE